MKVENRIINNNAQTPTIRMRRLRQSQAMRRLVRETHLSVDDLVYPLFVKEGIDKPQPIESMPDCFQFPLVALEDEILSIVALDIPAVLLFGIPEHKDAVGSASLKMDSVVAQSIRTIKKTAPALLVIADVCFCEYTDHGHCGVIEHTPSGLPDVANDQTLEHLVAQSVALAKAGADVIAPSGMMDGMVAAIRAGLDEAGFQSVAVLSYAIKYASALYGPFRDAAEGAPQFGDRSTYQMDIADKERAIREAELDVSEGADMLMVKPATFYLDTIARVKHAFPELPMAAYQVSGEYAMVKAAAQNGWLDENRIMMESLMAMKRAGADILITYFAKQAAALLQCQN